MIKKLNLFVGLMALFMLISCGRNRDTTKPDNTDNTTGLKYSETLIKYHNAEYKSDVINLILYIQNYESKINLSLAEQPDLNDIEKFYRKGGGQFWIAVENNRVIGTIGIMNKGNGFGIMKKFFVKADFRSQGIGLKLYNCLFRYAKKHKIRSDYQICL